MDTKSRQEVKDFTIDTDGVTVWVNDQSLCLGRFGRFGIDIHRKIERLTNTVECLYCTHTRTTESDWEVFVAKMAELHGVTIPASFRPERFQIRESRKCQV